MPVLQAQIETERASRYLVQFCKHAAAMGDGGHTPRMHLHKTVDRGDVQVAAEWSETSGTVTFTPWGRCTLTADTGILTIHLDATDDGLGMIRDIVTRDFDRFSQRTPLTINWQRSDDPGAAPFQHIGTVKPRRRSTVQIVLLALALIVVVGLHLGLAGTAVAGSRWTGMATNLIVALILLKVVLIGVARHRIRRRPL